MKRNFIAAAVCAAAVICGCSRQDCYQPVNVCVEKEFLSVFEETSRTSVDSDGRVDWCAGDVVSYYSSDNGPVGKDTLDNGGHTAVIRARMGAGDSYLVAACGASSISDNTLSGCLLDGALTAQQSGAFADAHVAVARCSDIAGAELQFRNVSGMISFSLTRSDVAYVIFHSSEGTVLHGGGRLKIDLRGDSPSASFPQTGCGETIKILAGGSGTFYFATLPCELDGVTFELFDKDGDAIGSAVSENCYELGRSMLLEFGELDSHIVPAPAVARIGGKQFSSYDRALAALNASDTAATLQMLSDWSKDGSVTFNNKKSTTILDLNGFHLTASIVYGYSDSLVITDSSSGASGSISTTGDYLLSINSGKVNLAGGNIFAAKKGVILMNTPSRFFMTGGRYSAAGNFFESVKGKISVTGGCFNKLPEIELEYPYVPFCENDTSYRVIVAKARIGVSRWGGNWEIFRNAIMASGGYPVRFDRYATTSTIASKLLADVDALIIPGKASKDTSVRAACEKRLLQECLDRGKPALGVCYGIQQINKFKGGNVPSVESLAPNTPYTHKLSVSGVNVGVRQETHPIVIDKSSILCSILGGATSMMVNTSHDYACGKIGTGLKVVATAPDGIVEAVEPTDGSMMYGVQFHPEALYHYAGNTRQLAIFKYFISKAAEVRK